MGLQVGITLYAPTEADAFRAASAAFEEIARLDQIMSDYRRDSELMRLVSRAGEAPVAVSEDLYVVLEAALEMARLTDGAFDVSISPLSRLWRHAIRGGALPTKAQIDSARALVGWRNIHLDPADTTVRLARRGMTLDLGGIAKGYAADAALRVLEEKGVPRALIEFGGDVRAGAPPPEAEAWTIEIAESDSLHRSIAVRNAAVAASGDTEQYVEIDDFRYSHVVDPATGTGLSTRAAATVIAPTGLLADAVATVLTLVDTETGKNLLEAHFPAARAYVRIVDGSRVAAYSTF